MNKFKLSLLGSMIGLSLNHAAFALDPPTSISTNGTNEMVFIENETDKEYFISAETLTPRFTGANVWTKYGRINQTSLGYMQVDSGSFNSAANVDAWMESPNVSYPFIGIRCQDDDTGCPSTSYGPAALVDQSGAYKMTPPNPTRNRRISFNKGMYDYIRDMPINLQTSFIVNFCETRLDYDPNKGERCKDMSTGTWSRSQTHMTKTAHLKLFDNHAFSEIWVATDGTPSLTSNNDACEYIVLGTSGSALNQRRNQGVACKMVKYHLDGQPSAFNPRTFLYMVIDNAALNNMSINAQDIKINAGGSTSWANWSAATGSGNRMDAQMVSGDGYVRVLFTKEFF